MPDSVFAILARLRVPAVEHCLRMKARRWRIYWTAADNVTQVRRCQRRMNRTQSPRCHFCCIDAKTLGAQNDLHDIAQSSLKNPTAEIYRVNGIGSIDQVFEDLFCAFF